MKTSSATQIPPAPDGCSAWPWTTDAPGQSTPPDFNWPKISIVTPSFNQGQFLEETIRSVLLQGYPNLEYIIIDGGSSDRSAEIIRKYERWISFWVSEKDRGQPHAINKGWARATGEILAWINSDDWYQPNALHEAARAFMSNPDRLWLAGHVENCVAPSRVIKRFRSRPTSLAQCIGRKDYGFHQPGIFWRRELIEKLGPLDESLHYSFDHDFWIRTLLLNCEPLYIDACLAGFRRHMDSKTCSRLHQFLEEDWNVFRRYESHLGSVERKQARCWLREYEAEALLISAYGLLAQNRRLDALRHLLARLHVFPHLKPMSLGIGALYRTVVTGKPPAWFGANSECT